MKLGVALPQMGDWAKPDNVIRIAQKAEEAGYNSVWAQERLLWPLEPKRPYPATPDGHLPEVYQFVLDPIVSLAYAASNTEKIRIGSSIINLPYHTPAVLAKQLATLDLISKGRFDFGIGLGWSEDEYIATNVPFEKRGTRVDEFLRCILNLWTEEVSEFNGTFYQVPKSIVNPKPLQKPHPPITVGGFNPRTFERAVNLGNGYNGIIMPFDQMKGMIDGVKKAAEISKRNLSDLQIVCRGFTKIMDQSAGKGRSPLTGTVGEIKDDLKRFEEMGITEIFFEFNFVEDITTGKALSYIEKLAPG
jgi:probable F420-dependent oxidoreductase